MTERKGVTVQMPRSRCAAVDADRRHAAAQGRGRRHDLRHLGHHRLHLQYIDQVIGKREGVCTYAAMNGLMLPDRQVFLVDTHVNYDPTAEQLAEITVMAAEEMMRFGVKPKVALLSHSNFGSSEPAQRGEDARARALLRDARPGWRSTARCTATWRSTARRARASCRDSALAGDANLLVLPNIDAANISYNLLKTAAGGNIAIGPVLLGAAKPVHILTASATVRRIVNMTALTVAESDVCRSLAQAAG